MEAVFTGVVSSKASQCFTFSEMCSTLGGATFLQADQFKTTKKLCGPVRVRILSRLQAEISFEPLTGSIFYSKKR